MSALDSGQCRGASDHDRAWLGLRGVAHLALTPEDLIPVVGLAILAGLRARPRTSGAVRPSGVLACRRSCGLLIARPASDFAAALSLLLVGGLVAADAPLSPWATARSPRFSPRPTAMQMDRVSKRRQWSSNGLGDRCLVFVCLRSPRRLCCTLRSAGPDRHAVSGSWIAEGTVASRLVATRGSDHC